MNQRALQHTLSAASLVLLHAHGSLAAPPINRGLDVPGYSRAVLGSVSLAESERAIHSRVLPDNLNTHKPPKPHGGKAAAAPTAPASIDELARALRHDPDLIFEFVRNNIEYYPIWGTQKGALGALLDGRGTAFDQAALIVELLASSGFSATYELGQINLTGAQLASWLGVSAANACAVRSLLANGAIPIGPADLTPTGASGNCGPLVSAVIPHVWVKVGIGGNQYVFDPSYKPHTSKVGINITSASGYVASSYLATARSGYTLTADYVQGINRTGLRSSLTTYSNTLLSYLRTNFPAGQLDDLVGGQSIISYQAGPLRQTSLPYQAATPQDLTTVSPAYAPTLTVAYAGINQSFTSDVLSGSRLTITYDASHRPQLWLNSVLVQTSASTVAFDAPSNVTLSIIHPTSSSLNQSFVQQVIPKTTASANLFLIGSSWGPTGRGLVELHRTSLDSARAAGSASTSEGVLGAAMAVLSATWITQVDRATSISDRLTSTTTSLHHRVGIAGYNGGGYVDLPGNLVSVTSQTANSAMETTAFFNVGMHSSIFESTAVQQTTSASAVSTVKLLDLAVYPNNLRIYDARSTNFASAVRPTLSSTCSTAQLDDFQSQVSAGARLILPQRCNLNENNWTGIGYFKVTTTPSLGIGALIGGSLAGGFASTSQTSAQVSDNTYTNSISSDQATVSTGSTFGDPVDMVKGHYLYDHTDFSVGVGLFPYSLPFQRRYSSGLRTQDGPLGLGWTHNFAISVATGSDGMQALGEDSALDAAASVVELMVSQDLLSDATLPLDKIVIATLGQRWFGDQLVGNSVIVKNGLNGEIFLKLTDGTYNPPPGNAAKLTKNSDATYSYEALHKARMDFSLTGKITKYSLFNGVQATFTYSGNDLTTVANSLGRQLTLTNVSGRLTKVASGTRNVLYTESAGNLTKVTDTLSKDTTYSYDAPGRLKQIFYPSNPTIAAMTNEYDSLSRVKTQANAFGKIYTYYFAGARSEEVAPDASSKVSYLDGLGNVLEAINPVGQVTLNVYDGQSRLVTAVLPELNRIEYEYDDASCATQPQLRCTHNIKTLRQVPKPGSVEPTVTNSFTYETAFNYVNHATDGLGSPTDFTYTAQGDPLTVILPAAASGVRPMTTYAYTGFTPSGWPTFYMPSSVTRKIDATQSTTTTTSYKTTNAYVPQTTVIDSGTNKLNLTSTYTYDTVGNLTNVDGPRTDVTDTTGFTYDSERRLTKITDAKGRFTTFGYDADGRRTRTSAQMGAQWFVSCSNYTASGKALKGWGPAISAVETTCPAVAAPVPVTDYAYDDLDRVQQVTVNLTTLEGGNRVSQTDYWPDGRIRTLRRATGTTLAQPEVGYSYTANGRIATLADAANNVTTYEYDGLDRRAKTRYPSAVTAGESSTTDYEQYSHDNNGSLTTLRTRGGQSVILTYDALSRIVSRSYPAATADNLVFGYDLLNRPVSADLANGSYAISYAWDNAGRPLSTTAGGKTLAYQYDAAGNRTRTTWPEATTFYVTTVYDELNRPTFVKELGTTTLAQYNYDDLSRRSSVTLGNATSTMYGYDPQGTLQSKGHDLAGTAQDVTFSYTRNQAQEIVTRSWNNESYAWAGAQDTRNFTANGLNQYTAVNGTSYAYDGNGNLSGDGNATYTYDADNRLRTANVGGVAGTLTWDASGRLRQTALGPTTTNLLYDGERLVAEYDASGNLMRRFVHGFGVDEPLVKYEGAGTASKNWYYADHLGSVVANADSTGAASASFNYGPFGELGNTAPGRFGYTGQQYLATLGLYHYKARFYSPSIGRFLQTDPIRIEGGINLYTYVKNSPLAFSDSFGLSRSNSGSFLDPSHSYSLLPALCDTSNSGCSRAVSFSGLQRNWYPGVSQGELVRDGGTYFVFGSPITSTVDNDNLTIVNTTQSNHLFCCGSVSLSIVQQGSTIYLSIQGSGRNSSWINAAANWVAGQIGFVGNVQGIRDYIRAIGQWSSTAPIANPDAPPSP